MHALDLFRLVHTAARRDGYAAVPSDPNVAWLLDAIGAPLEAQTRTPAPHGAMVAAQSLGAEGSLPNALTTATAGSGLPAAPPVPGSGLRASSGANGVVASTGPPLDEATVAMRALRGRTELDRAEIDAVLQQLDRVEWSTEQATKVAGEARGLLENARDTKELFVDFGAVGRALGKFEMALMLN